MVGGTASVLRRVIQQWHFHVAQCLTAGAKPDIITVCDAPPRFAMKVSPVELRFTAGFSTVGLGPGTLLIRVGAGGEWNPPARGQVFFSLLMTQIMLVAATAHC